MRILPKFSGAKLTAKMSEGGRRVVPENSVCSKCQQIIDKLAEKKRIMSGKQRGEPFRQDDHTVVNLGLVLRPALN